MIEYLYRLQAQIPLKEDFARISRERTAAIVRSFANASYLRSLFVTISGYAGLGSKITRESDIVAILYGGKTPYVLRPYGEEWQLAGECHIYGVMDGEAVDQHKSSGEADDVFWIR